MTQLLTTTQAQHLLGFRHRSSIIRYVDTGRLPYAHKLEGETNTYLFDADVIEKFRAERAEKGKP